MKKRTRKKSRRRKAGAKFGGYQVFVSHATADKWIARVVCEKLEECGATTFRDDRDINGGDDIPDEIRRQIRRSKELVVLLAPQSVGRSWVLIETGAAWCWSRDLRIVIVRYHVDVDPIPDMLKSKKSISLNGFDDYLTELTARIAKFRK